MSEITLQQLLNDRVQQYTDSQRPAELIDAGIDKLFKDVVDDAFRSYGDFGKAIKLAVSEALPANVNTMFDLAKYNKLISESLKQRWLDAAVSEQMLTSANKAIDEVLDVKYLTGEVKLSEFFSAFVEHHKEEAAENGWERPEIRVEEGGSTSTEFLHIYFDESPEDSTHRSSKRSSYALKHALHVRITSERKEGEGHWIKTVQLGEVYSARLEEKKIAVDMQIHDKWERILASLYFGNATLVLDCDTDDITYGLCD